jgi:hypothetical protein
VQFLSELNPSSLAELDSKQRTPVEVANENNQQSALNTMRRIILLQQLGDIFGTKAQRVGWFALPLLVPIIVYLLMSSQWLSFAAVLSVFVIAHLAGVLPYFFARNEYFICGCACALWGYVVLPHSLFYSLDAATHVSLVALRLVIALLYLYSALSSPRKVEKDEIHVVDNRKVCPTCRTKIPLRTKHCRITNTCVARFDHYCVWIANSVGAHNHVPFVGFLLTVLLSNIISIVISGAGLLTVYSTSLSFYEFARTLESYGHSFFIVVNAAMLIWLAVLSKAQLHGVLYNITFNEQVNWRKYSYLQSDGKFTNPFDLVSKLQNINDFLFSLSRYNNNNFMCIEEDACGQKHHSELECCKMH